MILGCNEDVRSITLFPRKVKDVISAHCSYLKYQHVFEVKSCSTTLWYTRNGISTSLTGSTCSNGGFSSFPSMLEKTGVFHLEKPPTCPLVFFLRSLNLPKVGLATASHHHNISPPSPTKVEWRVFFSPVNLGKISCFFSPTS